MASGVQASMRSLWHLAQLPPAARAARRLDRAGLPAADHGPKAVLEASMRWLCAAQDHSASGDGGVARDFSLIKGWATSYPETTGYIIPTFIEYARRSGDQEMRERARRMADWLVRIQLPSGGVQGGKVDSRPVVPVTFNTGQVLLGLAAAEAEFGGYASAMRRAADWLVETQDADGCWRRFPTPFAAVGEKEYETHVAWGLFEAERLAPGRSYGDAALANVRWALSSQGRDGWFPKCCLDDPSRPLIHTIAYALRGVLEAYRFSSDPQLLAAAGRTADGLLSALRDDGWMPGRFRPGWLAAADSVCLTGNAQVASCWFRMFEYTGDARYRDAACLANRFVRRTVQFDGPPETRGGTKGSFPVDGNYAPYEYVSWAAKFLADSLMLEMDIAIEPRTDLSSYRERESERERIADLLALSSRASGTALDIGTRDGHLARLLADRFDRVAALDLVLPAVADPRIDCVAGDVTRLPFADDSFDLVVCAEVLEHIDPPLLRTASSELMRVTRGHLLIGVPYKQDTRVGRTTCIACGACNPPWGHLSTFDEARLRGLFDGMAVVRTSFVGIDDNTTNSISSGLMDLAGNPYGTYGQDEVCAGCGNRLLQPPRRRLHQRILTRAAHWTRSLTKPFKPVHPTWIHLLLAKR
jgi:SAM-dependent methyltransferase